MNCANLCAVYKFISIKIGENQWHIFCCSTGVIKIEKEVAR